MTREKAKKAFEQIVEKLNAMETPSAEQVNQVFSDICGANKKLYTQLVEQANITLLKEAELSLENGKTEIVDLGLGIGVKICVESKHVIYMIIMQFCIAKFQELNAMEATNELAKALSEFLSENK